MRRAIVITFLGFLLASCGKNAMPWERPTVYTTSVEPAEAEEYQYELGNNKCSTGTHSYSSLVQVCEALLDNELNNHCVEQQRLELYASSCPEGLSS